MAKGADPVEKSRVRWHCRRGMKELDVLLERFMTTGYDEMDDPERECFRALLDRSDPDLYALIMGRIEPDNAAEARLIAVLRCYKTPPGVARSPS